MNIYELRCGYAQYFTAAESEEGAYNNGTDPLQFPEIHYLPFTVKLVEIPGYTITVKSNTVPIEDMDRDQLKAWLTERSIEFAPQLGENKLRELALQHV